MNVHNKICPLMSISIGDEFAICQGSHCAWSTYAGTCAVSAIANSLNSIAGDLSSIEGNGIIVCEEEKI